MISIISSILSRVLFSNSNIVITISLALIGFIFPLLWLRSLILKRSKEIINELPRILDLLTLSVEAGLDFISAISRIVEKGDRSILIFELKHMLGLIRLGQTRSEALIELRQRLAHSAIHSFVGMLLQADRLGTPIGPVLRAHAGMLRTEQFQRAEKAGVIASQKLLVPLIFCIMPAVFIIVFGPLLVMWRSGYFERLF